MKHTPGPWNLNTCNGKIPVVREIKQPHGEASTFVASLHSRTGYVCRLDFGYGKPDDVANARLIENAPDLLAMCKEAYEFIGGDMSNPAIGRPLRAVIAKAEGAQ